MKNALFINWKTTLAGIPAVLGGLSALCYALGPVFHSLAAGQLADLINEWPAVVASVAAISTGVGLFVAKDASAPAVKAALLVGLLAGIVLIGPVGSVSAAPVKRYAVAPVAQSLAPLSFDPLHIFPSPNVPNVPGSPPSSLYSSIGGIIKDLQGFSTSDLTAALADAEAVVPSSGGTGYAVGDTITLPNNITIMVASVGATGNVLTVTLTTAGLFPTTSPVATPISTSGKGVGATFTQNDTVAATCWAMLLPVVINFENPLPAQPGIFLAIQKARDLADNGGTILASVQNGPINTACAPVVMTTIQTVNGLITKGTAAAAAIAVVAPK
ncbi:MAG TPA: hypothetical protein VL996_05470 [Methylocella sp.]|nr:hypothetical protein [Methylocella sp.]